MKITNFRQLSAVLLLACVSCASFAAPTQQEAQAFGMNTPADNGDGRLQLGGEQAMSGQANTSSTTGTFAQQNRQGMLLPGESDVRKLLPQSESGLPPPYGANLFAGGYETERSDGLNDNYLIAPGDKLNIWIWGAVNFSNVVTVDNQGNIFIPDVGPINVKNVAAISAKFSPITLMFTLIYLPRRRSVYMSPDPSFVRDNMPDNPPTAFYIS